jgi:hypothetical protein
MQSGTGLALQLNHSAESIGSGWTSYVTSGEWGSGGFLAPNSPRTDWTIDAYSFGDATSPAAIIAGGAPLSIWSAGPELPTQMATDNLQQVAELIPSDESSLALVGTLWTVPSDGSKETLRGRGSDASLTSFRDRAVTPSSTAYMMGLDHALEQSHRELQQLLSSSPWRLILTEREQLELDRQLEWERPILPIGTGWVSDRLETPTPDTTLVVDNKARSARSGDPSPSLDHREMNLQAGASADAPGPSDLGSFLKAGSLALLSALSVSVAITGWFWTRRNRRRRLGLRALGASIG